MTSAITNYFQRLSEETGAAWNRFWFTPASPVPLARLRIAVGLLATVYFLSWLPHIGRLLGDDGLLPGATVQELLRAQNRHLYHLSPLFKIGSPAGLIVWNSIAVVTSLQLTCGIFSRVSCLATLAMLLTFVHRAPMLTSPFETVLVMLLFYLMLGPCGAALSVDAWRAEQAGRSLNVPSWTANLSQRLIQVHTAGLIWLVACALLSSRFWWNGTAIWSLESQELSRPFDLAWLRNFPKLVNGWTHLFVLVNLAFPILVWNRLLRPLVVVITIAVWLSMLLVTGQLLYIAAVTIAMCLFLANSPRSAQVVIQGKS